MISTSLGSVGAIANKTMRDRVACHARFFNYSSSIRPLDQEPQVMPRDLQSGAVLLCFFVSFRAVVDFLISSSFLFLSSERSFPFSGNLTRDTVFPGSPHAEGTATNRQQERLAICPDST
jgi:hypothetical protein